MNTNNASETSRNCRGVPTPDLKCEEGFRQLCALVEANTDESILFFHAGFLPIFDTVMSKLIEWTEGSSDCVGLKELAGHVLADRLRFLSAQKGFWEKSNSGFEKRWAEFGDLRGARTPEVALAWQAGDYLRMLVSERSNAHLFLSPMGDNSYAIADIIPDFGPKKKWLERLIALPNFNEASWPAWADAVFDRMSEDEDSILAQSELRGKQTRDSSCPDRRPSGKVRLYDWKKTIQGAVQSLASKPVGTVRGITRPSS